jgi:hypothetical protein
VALACAAATLAACDRGAGRAAENVSLTWTFAPDPPSVGRSTLTLQLGDERGQPLRGARVRVEANMTHPGMRPVVAEAAEKEAGRYHVELEFSMAGSWFVLVTGDRPQGGSFSRRIDVAHVRAR